MSVSTSTMIFYPGSTILTPYAQAVGIQVDKFNFLVAGLSSVLLGYLYNYLLPPGRVHSSARKVFLLLSGLSILFFCFGKDTWHVINEAVIGYIILRVVPIEHLPQVTLVTSILYQTICHLIRQFTPTTDGDQVGVDITGPVMMLTMRLSTLAFSLRDHVYPQGRTQEQLREAIAELPDALSFFSYLFDFHVVLVGPLISYNEFLHITEGKAVQGGEETPSPHWEVFRKLFYVAVNAVLVLKAVRLFTGDDFLEDWFLDQPFYRRLLCLYLFSILSRVQYYLVWKLSEAVCNSSGYGYSLKDGKHCWDGANNIRIFKLETAPSLKVVLENWNVSTQKWLRHVCYDRDISRKTFATFLLSAIWHGFYPGYFMAFMSCSFFVSASRQVRRSLRPRFVVSKATQAVYDVLTWLFTIFFLAYTTAPFVLLEFNKGVHVWREVYYFGHWMALGAFALPYVLPPLKRSLQTEEEMNGNIEVTLSSKLH